MTEVRGLVRYWITFEADPPPPPTPGTISLDGGRWGPTHVGVTAFDRADALDLVCERWWPDGGMPEAETILEDVDVSTLPVEGRVLGVPIWRGIWYPATTL